MGHFSPDDKLLLRRWPDKGSCQNGNDAKTLSNDGLVIDLDARSVTTENGMFELPPKDFDILLYCAKKQGRILTKQQIYEAIWGEPYVYYYSRINH